MKEEKKIGCVLTRNEGIPRGRRKKKAVKMAQARQIGNPLNEV